MTIQNDTLELDAATTRAAMFEARWDRVRKAKFDQDKRVAAAERCVQQAESWGQIEREAALKILDALYGRTA